MAKQKSHVTTDRSKKKGPNHCGTITQEDFLLMDRAHRRQEQIDSGVNNAARGTGRHGGSKEQLRRRDRRNGKDEIRKGSFD